MSVEGCVRCAGMGLCWFVRGAVDGFVGFMSPLRRGGRFFVNGVGTRGDGLQSCTNGQWGRGCWMFVCHHNGAALDAVSSACGYMLLVHVASCVSSLYPATSINIIVF